MKKNWFYLTFIFGLTMAVIFFWESPPKILTSDRDNREESALTPYSIINDAQTQHFDDNGDLSYQFTAKTLKHYRLNLDHISDGDYTTLEAPMLTLFTQDGPWFITAENGKATNTGERIALWNNVRIWQSNDGGQQATELTTDKLTIEPSKKVVRTKSPVKITSAQGSIEAIGMNVNLISKRIKLLKQVRGHHEPI